MAVVPVVQAGVVHVSGLGLFGVPVYLTPMADHGTLYWAIDPARPVQQSLFIGCRPLAPLEQAGKDARLAVRRGLADVLEWLGQPVENEPTGQEIFDRMMQAADR